MRKIFTIASLTVFIIGLLVWFLGRGAAPAVPSTDPVVTGASEDEGLIRELPEDAPKGPTLDIGTSGGSVRVKNFYLTALGIEEGHEVVLKDSPAYTISYLRRESNFWIILNSAPVASSRAAAEKDLLAVLDIPQTTACRLAVTVVVPTTVDPNAPPKSRLSFCSGGVE